MRECLSIGSRVRRLRSLRPAGVRVLVPDPSVHRFGLLFGSGGLSVLAEAAPLFEEERHSGGRALDATVAAGSFYSCFLQCRPNLGVMQRN